MSALVLPADVTTAEAGRGLVVAQVLSSLDPGGQERVALALGAELCRRGHRVIAISLAPARRSPIADAFADLGADVCYLPKRRGLDFLLPFQLARLFRREEVRLVHTHNPLPLIYGAPAGKLAGAAVVHTKHGKNPSGRGSRLLRRLAARFADAFVAVSDETAAQARSLREVGRADLAVVTNGIDLERFVRDDLARGRVRRELEIPDRARVIGTVGRIDANKNQALLLAAAAPLLGPDVHLVFAGDGPMRRRLQRSAGRLRARRSVHFTGWREDIPALMAGFDVFALSSRSEGLPLVVPEAMAAGLPVVTTAVGGLPSVVSDGETGYLIAPGDFETLRARLTELVRDPDRAAAMGRRGRSHAVLRHASDRMAREYLAIYRDALARTRGIL